MQHSDTIPPTSACAIAGTSDIAVAVKSSEQMHIVSVAQQLLKRHEQLSVSSSHLRKVIEVQ